MWFLALWVVGILAAMLEFSIIGRSLNMSELCGLLLHYQFIVTFSLIGIIGCIENIVLVRRVPNWHQRLYQTKYGFSQLGLGLIGFMAIWFHGSFQVGVLVSMYVYGMSGFWTHTMAMIENKKVDKLNLANLVMNIFYQTFITVLSIFSKEIWHV